MNTKLEHKSCFIVYRYNNRVITNVSVVIFSIEKDIFKKVYHE